MMVTLGGVIAATELMQESTRTKPRFAIVVTLVFEGRITFEELTERVQQNWINATEENGRDLKYPEFRQYIESWMGYLFWKQDKSFNLANHLTHQECKISWTEKRCEQFASSVVEDLLNKPFPDGRSPWEVKMISNYRNSDRKETTILVFRFHHCLADGFAIFFMIYDRLFGIPFSKCTIARLSAPKSATSCFETIMHFTSLPIRAIRELGYAGSLMLFPIRTPWYIPEGKRTGRQLYIRSEKIPLIKLKLVKDTFGVSFTSTLISSVAAGIASSFKSKGFPNHLKDMPSGSPVPLKNHPQKLRNHWTATLYNISIDQTLSPLERLRESEKHFQNAKQSTYPHIFLIALKLTALQLPFIANAWSKNPSFSTALTNFPGPGEQMQHFGRDLVGMDFGTGLLCGVAGAGFMLLSYNDHLRMSFVAENAAMERHEMEELMKAILDEIDKLYELAQSDHS